MSDHNYGGGIQILEIRSDCDRSVYIDIQRKGNISVCEDAHRSLHRSKNKKIAKKVKN